MEGTYYNGLYLGEALPERGTLFSGFKYMKDYKGNLSFLPRSKRANRCIEWLWKSKENILVMCVFVFKKDKCIYSS